ncbi:MMPL family transporter [Zavarzinia sp. CC-PAN008]|uniref:MMPL family transporter n=1 Tax=Zavarzinia sp. CC-PAN008 TaxID=3243332 RepID=UPI003F745E28
MFHRALEALVTTSARYALATVLILGVLSGLLGLYVSRTTSMDTDPVKLMSTELPWRQREIRFDAAFPESVSRIAIVLDAPTPELGELAADRLAQALRERHAAEISSVHRPDGGPYFARNAFLFEDTDQVQSIADSLIAAQPLLGALAADPSLRGVMAAMDLAAEGIARGEAPLADLTRAFDTLADSVEGALAGRYVPLPWARLVTDQEPDKRALRRFILVQAQLDFSGLSPAAAAAKAIKDEAQALGLVPERGYRVRLTGSPIIADEEFGTIAEGAATSTVAAFVLVGLMMVAAVGSYRAIIAIMATLSAGLAWTFAFANSVVGALNPISVAFAVMFIDIAVDFSIQMTVRYREERQRGRHHMDALRATAGELGASITLAAVTTAVGFLAFTPTAYVGVAQLGLIAGAGMMVALFLNLTLFPALLSLLHLPPVRSPIGFQFLRPADRFVLRHRKAILGTAAVLALAGLALLPRLTFDFNPLNLRDPETEGMSTILDLMKDPETTVNTIDVLSDTLDQAAALAQRLETLPEVKQALTLASFVPTDQADKLAILEDANFFLQPTLNPPAVAAPPDDAALVAALRQTTAKLSALPGQDAATARLRAALTRLAEADAATRALASASVTDGLAPLLDGLRAALSATPVTLDDVPQALRDDWLAKDGRARIEVFPSGYANDNAVLRQFVAAVRPLAPDAVGAPISVQESADTMVDAFITATLLALAAITVVLALMLRRVHDVLLVLIPLLFSAILTLAITVVIGMPINFANIIALPLLLSIGVSFAIYFVTRWRGGEGEPLSSPLARAVLFSGLTSVVAFGALAASSHPGTASLGLLLMIALGITQATVFLLQPALLGPPPAASATPAPQATASR